MKALLMGCIARMPYGGNIWHYLQYALGLRDLGVEVWYLEAAHRRHSDFYYIDEGLDAGDPAPGVATLRAAMERHGLGGRWACTALGEWHGAPREEFEAQVQQFDFCVNMGTFGNLPRFPNELMEIPARILVDTDPAFLQIALAEAGERELEGLRRHTHFATFAENIFGADCRLPDCGVPWIPTRQPILLNEWKSERRSPDAPYTTVLSLGHDERSVEWEGGRYGMKSGVFREYAALPSMVDEDFEICTPSQEWPAVREVMNGHNWRLASSERLAQTAGDYRRYLQGSKAEFGVAKHAYVESRSGWFSERSACYLACGKPVVAQDTGFGVALPAGEGLFAVSDVEEAVEAVKAIGADYDRHCDRALEIAESHFEATGVLKRLLAHCGIDAPS